MLSGLSSLNIELTAKCHRKTLCAFCFHQQSDKLTFGDMPLALVKDIRQQLESGTLTIQFHRDGDPLAYPALGEALDEFAGFVRSLVTHGETLYEQADAIIDRCESVTVSIFSPDPDASMQYESVRKFLEVRGSRLPRVLIKAVGVCEHLGAYEALGLPILRRKLHTAVNERYVRTVPLLPESGVCLDFLSKPAIAWTGKVYQCVRFDETDDGYLGSLYENTLDEIWNGERRKAWLFHHVQGEREKANPRCASCTYYGIPVAA